MWTPDAITIRDHTFAALSGKACPRFHKPLHLLPATGIVLHIDREQVVKVAEGALYTAVGLGVLTFQQAQVRRQQVWKALQPLRDSARDRIQVVQERLRTVEGEA